MHTYNDTQLSPYSTQQIFDLVMDIERYPEFLPWCRAARIIERNEQSLIAELVVSFTHVRESYVSEVIGQRPASPQDTGWIEVRLREGPFKQLSNQWAFKPMTAGGSEIGLVLSFQFRSRLLDSLIGIVFGKAAAKMALAFKERADALYNGKS